MDVAGLTVSARLSQKDLSMTVTTRPGDSGVPRWSPLQPTGLAALALEGAHGVLEADVKDPLPCLLFVSRVCVSLFHECLVGTTSGGHTCQNRRT
jgi:hypothetical protein